MSAVPATIPSGGYVSLTNRTPSLAKHARMPIILRSIVHIFVIVVGSPKRRDRPRPVSCGEFINFGAPIACCSVTIPCGRASCSANGGATRAVRSGFAVGDPPRLDEPRTPPRPQPDSPACGEAAGQDGGCPRSPRARLRLVHRGVRDDGPEGGKALLDERS